MTKQKQQRVLRDSLGNEVLLILEYSGKKIKRLDVPFTYHMK